MEEDKSIIKKLYVSRYLHFFVVGCVGTFINLFITFILTEFIFGKEKYFTAYLIGLLIAILYNFTIHTIITFKTKNNHTKRLITFMLWSLFIAYIEAVNIKYITKVLGVDYYIFIIAGVILVYSTFSFLVCKLILFKEEENA